MIPVDPGVMQLFGRHLVALCITFRYADRLNELPQFRAYAGTLIALGGGVHFVTAGHILSELREGLRDDRIIIHSAVLADTFGMGRHGMPIPFDIKDAPIFFIDDDEAGLDFGVILLRPYYVRLLAANDTVAILEENWIHQHRVNFDGYLMLGLPEEFTSSTINVEGIGQLSPTLLVVKKLDAPPVGSPVTQYPEFIGTLKENFGLKSVKGMSGGPIFGIGAESPRPPNLPSCGVIIEHLRDRVLWKIACVSRRSSRRHDRRRGEAATRGVTDCQPGIPAVRCPHREEWVLRRRGG